MSKKNKNKFKNADVSTPLAVAASEAAAKPQTVPGDDLIKEFKHLAIVILFILALLFVIDYYNEKADILRVLTDKLYSLF